MPTTVAPADRPDLAKGLAGKRLQQIPIDEASLSRSHRRGERAVVDRTTNQLSRNERRQTNTSPVGIAKQPAWHDSSILPDGASTNAATMGSLPHRRCHIRFGSPHEEQEYCLAISLTLFETRRVLLSYVPVRHTPLPALPRAGYPMETPAATYAAVREPDHTLWIEVPLQPVQLCR